MTVTRPQSARGGFSRYVHRLELEAPVRTPEPSGGAGVAYALVAEVWGEVRGISGDERLDADRLQGRITHIVRIRHREGITPDLRFRLGQRTFAIRSVLDRDGRRRDLECRCEEIAS